MHKALFVIGILLLVPFTVPVAPAQTTKAPYQLEWWLYNTGNETVNGYKIINSTDGLQVNVSISNVYYNYSYVYNNVTTNVTIHDQWLYDVSSGFVVGWDREYWSDNGTVLYVFAFYRIGLLKLRVNSTIEIRGLGWYTINDTAPTLFLKDNVTQQVTKVWVGNITVNKVTVPTTYFDSITINSTSKILDVVNPGPDYGYWGAVSNVTRRPVIMGYGPWSQSNFTMSAMSIRQSPAITPAANYQSFKRLIDFQVSTPTSTDVNSDGATIDSTTNIVTSLNENTNKNSVPIFISFIFGSIMIITIMRKLYTLNNRFNS